VSIFLDITQALRYCLTMKATTANPITPESEAAGYPALADAGLPVESVAICPECGLECPDDDRVAAGMRCGTCAYGNLSIGQAYERDRDGSLGLDDFEGGCDE